MTSPLDGRIRNIVRDELNGAGGTEGGEDATLLQQINDLHDHLHRNATVLAKLEERVAELERTGVLQPQVETALRRTRTKRTDQ